MHWSNLKIAVVSATYCHVNHWYITFLLFQRYTASVDALAVLIFVVMTWEIYSGLLSVNKISQNVVDVRFQRNLMGRLGTVQRQIG